MGRVFCGLGSVRGVVCPGLVVGKMAEIFGCVTNSAGSYGPISRGLIDTPCADSAPHANPQPVEEAAGYGEGILGSEPEHAFLAHQNGPPRVSCTRYFPVRKCGVD